MSNAVKGQDFMISIRVNGVYKPICHATDFTLSEDYENIEISGPQGKWRDYISSYAGYTLQVPGVVAYLDDVNIVQLKQWGRAGTKLQWFASAFTGGGVSETGFMLITNITQTAQFRDAVRFDMSAVGCGELQTNLNDFVVNVYLADFDNVRLPGCPNPYPVVIYWYDGTFIGVADNPDDVVSLFNSYIGNEYYQIQVGEEAGCDFTLSAAWNAPEIPTVIFASAAGNFAMWSGNNNEVISPDQDNDQALTPIGA